MDAQTISMNKIQQEAAVKEAAPVQKAAGVEAVTPEKVRRTYRGYRNPRSQF